MATPNNPNMDDDVNSWTINQTSQMMLTTGDVQALLEQLSLSPRGEQHGGDQQVDNSSSTLPLLSSRPGAVDADTLELMLTQANQTFIPTRPYKDIKRTLEKNCHVSICGASGEGKTTMALMLGQKYRKQGFELVFVNRPDIFDLGACIGSGRKFCLIFDDIFGSVGHSNDFTFLQTLCNSLKMHIDNNLHTRLQNRDHLKHGSQGQGQTRGDIDFTGKHKHKSNTKEFRVIFTSKTYNFKEGISKMMHQHLSMFTLKTLVDLTLNPETSYSPKEKKAMFHKHRDMHPKIKLKDFEVEEIVSQDSALFGFPLTCRLFFDIVTFKEKAVDFFKHPLYYLRMELNDILSRRNDLSAALIIVLLCEGNVKLPDLEFPNTNKKVDEMYMYVTNFANTSSRSGVAAAARSFRGTFLSRGDNLCFAHSSIYEACACALYQFNPSFVLRYCSLDFLYERLKPGYAEEAGQSDQLNYLFASEEYFSLVVSRLLPPMKQGIFLKTVAHPMNQNEEFVERFLEELGKSASENNDWITEKEKERCFLYWVVRSKSTKLVKSIETVLSITFTQDDIREAIIASVECDSLAILQHLVTKLERNLDETELNSLLLKSAESNSKDMISYLLKSGAKITGTDTNRRNILHVLCIHDRPIVLMHVTSQHVENREELSKAKSARDKDGRTPLMLAVLHGSLDCFMQMQDEGQADFKDSNDNSLIHLACEGGIKTIVERILTNENINKRGNEGMTPIMVAAKEGNLEIVNLLLAMNADTTLVDDRGNILLIFACWGGGKHIVERLVTPDNINSRGQAGLTPIMAAADNAKSEVFDLLLAKNADTTLVDDYGDTLLHMACWGGSKHIVERLVTPGNINSRGQAGWTPIMAAADNAKSDVFDLLLAKNADTTLVDDYGDTLLHIACWGGSKQIVERLVTPDNIDSRGQDGRTPFMVAVGNSKSDVFDLLLAKNADTTLVDDHGDILLHIACRGGSKQIVERLVTPDNINSRGLAGWTPIMTAADNAKSDVFDLLLAKNADTTLVDGFGDTLLHIACWGGSKQIVERLVTPDNINSRGQDGRTPFMVAVVNSKSDVFDLLLAKNADTTLVDDHGDTLLHFACWGGSKQIVERLVTPDNINSRGQDGWTPIMTAADNAKSDVFDLLLAKNADTTLVDDHGDTLLHKACWGGSKQIVERLVTPDNINSRGQPGWTPIMTAADNAKSDVFDLLLAKNADTTLGDDHGDTLLHIACRGGSKQIVERLVTPDNINSRGQDGRTPFMVAVGNSKSDVFDLLLAKNADTTLVDDHGDTLLHFACWGGSKQIVERLVTPDNINSRGQDGRTPFMVAVGNSKSDVFDLLLAKNADTTLVDDHGDTLLHKACWGGSKQIVERLVTPDNINSRGQAGWTPIMTAADNAKSDVFDLLLAKNADTTLVDDHGDTLLHKACRGGSKQIVERLVTPDNINSRGQDGRTPFMVAVGNSKSDLFDLLLSNGADTTLVDDHGDT